MISNRKFTKYIIYATGEIILVVLGILIALQINNWNENRKAKLSENEILDRLTLEFEGAAFELSNDMNARYDILKVSDHISSLHLHSESNSFKLDSFSSTLFQLMRYRFFTQSHPALNDLQSSGRLELLSSKQLKEYLVDYLQAKERLVAFESTEMDFVDKKMKPFLSEHLDLLKATQPIDSIRNEQAKTFLKLLGQPTFGSLLYQRSELTKQAIYYSEIMEGVINDVLSELKKGR